MAGPMPTLARNVSSSRSATLRGAVGLILDAAVVALAVAVIGSLALLTWTLAVNAVRAAADGRVEVAAARRRVTETEARLHVAGARASEALARLNERTSDR